MKKLIYIFILTFLWTNVSNSDQTYLNLDEINLNKIIKNDVTNFPVYIGNTKNNKKKPINESLYQFTNLYSYIQLTPSAFIEPKKIHIDNKKYFAYSGCRYQSCSEKGLIWIDKEKKITVGLLLHYFFNSDIRNSNGDFLIFSKNLNDGSKLPVEFFAILKKWTSMIDRYDFNTKKSVPITPTKIRFINSKNEVSDITELFKNKIK